MKLIVQHSSNYQKNYEDTENRKTIENYNVFVPAGYVVAAGFYTNSKTYHNDPAVFGGAICC